VSAPPPADESGARPDVGLCAACVHAAVQRSAKASEFWRCRAADTDERLLRYPPLPVTDCHAFEEQGS
jgi:hypothetical protein